MYTKHFRKVWLCDMKPSGIGGQAVIEGIMMRNKDKYSIAVRKPDNEIEVVVRESRLITEKHPWLNLPIIRGIVSLLIHLLQVYQQLIILHHFMMILQSRRRLRLMRLARIFLRISLNRF